VLYVPVEEEKKISAHQANSVCPKTKENFGNGFNNRAY
jgi:hypothetical protein